MPRSATSLLAVITTVIVLAAPVARAANHMDLGTVYGTMVSQAVHTVGGSFVSCKGLLTGSVPATAQVACARLPADMFGYFKMGVHGRLYEYLARGTLRVDHAWRTVGDVLEVVYGLKSGTLTAERERVGNALYGVFEYVGNAGATTASASGH
ncbi:MAG: hypothetical protein P8099_19160 [Gemmatimonadota bacterium]